VAAGLGDVEADGGGGATKKTTGRWGAAGRANKERERRRRDGWVKMRRSKNRKFTL
jgi:hypothetical protein